LKGEWEMNVICKRETVKAYGLIKHVYVKEIVNENNKQYVQETFSTYVLGFCIRSTTEKRKISLKDAFANALG
jgi:hypothetical protein